MPLTPRQARFVEEMGRDENATQAAARAGYSVRTAKQQGARLLTNAAVQRALTAARSARSARVQVDADYVVRNLLEVIERCMQREPVMVRDGRDMVQATDDEGRHVWTFNGKVAVAAMALLAKHTGGFTERHEVTGKDGGPLEVAYRAEWGGGRGAAGD